MTRSLKAAAAAAILSIVLSGCGGSDDEDRSSNNTNSEMDFEEGAELSNPVEILKKIEGCDLEPGVEMGSRDVDGNLYAECDFPNSGSVTVRVVGTQPEGYGNEDQTVDDSHKVIYGTDWYATITADPSLFVSDIDVEEIAEQTGGAVAD